MNDDTRMPVAQYLRMSTERQHYSLQNQSEVIGRYAQSHGFSLVKTYSDAAKTGVVFRNRRGLQSLIQDVVQGAASYKAVLVYDVSRWGRFQDTDESAHYEFLCKSAGIPVHYCAEPFSNDTGLASLIMKSLKRVMAGEYSRELGDKVFAAQRRLACLGFRQGGQPGYGLRRLLISADGSPKQLLSPGERKGLASDRVIQVPGPAEEVRCVREIYRMFVQEKMTFLDISRELNRHKIGYLRGAAWNQRAVRDILTQPKYAGFNVYGRCSMRLYTPKVEVPRSEWAMVPGAFEAVVEPSMFEEAQKIIAMLTWNRSDQQILDVLKAILAKEGRLSSVLIESTPGAPSLNTYRTRFGSITRAYELIGYVGLDGFTRRGRLEEIRNIRSLRQGLMDHIVSLSDGRVSIEDRGLRYRTRLRMQGRQLVAVVVSRFFRGYKEVDRWRIKCAPSERRLVALVCRLNRQNNAFKDFFVAPPIGSRHLNVTEAAGCLTRALQITDFRDFVTAVRQVSMRR